MMLLEWFISSKGFLKYTRHILLIYPVPTIVVGICFDKGLTFPFLKESVSQRARKKPNLY